MSAKELLKNVQQRNEEYKAVGCRQDAAFAMSHVGLMLCMCVRAGSRAVGTDHGWSEAGSFAVLCCVALRSNLL
jgi:hypothetical protein